LELSCLKAFDGYRKLTTFGHLAVSHPHVIHSETAACCICYLSPFTQCTHHLVQQDAGLVDNFKTAMAQSFSLLF